MNWGKEDWDFDIIDGEEIVEDVFFEIGIENNDFVFFIYGLILKESEIDE